MIRTREVLKQLSSVCLSPSVKRWSSTLPARAVLYVPGSDSKKLSKIFDLSADCVVIDCEDGVALNRKLEARTNIRGLFNKESRIRDATKFAVRINQPQTQLAHSDISTIFSLDSQYASLPNVNDYFPKRVFVPKTNSSEDIKWLYDKLEAQLKSYKNKINFFFYMESAMSLINLRDIITTGLNESKNRYNGRFGLEGFVFGSDDFCADLSITRTQDAEELMYARQKLITYCKAYNLKAIDMVYIDFKDLVGLKKQSEQGARMGFTGKQVIHPGQIQVTHEAFSPSPAKIEWARGLVRAFDEHQHSGKGAFTYNGQMIDMPSLLQAKNILTIADLVINKS